MNLSSFKRTLDWCQSWALVIQKKSESSSPFNWSTVLLPVLLWWVQLWLCFHQTTSSLLFPYSNIFFHHPEGRLVPLFLLGKFLYWTHTNFVNSLRTFQFSSRIKIWPLICLWSSADIQTDVKRVQTSQKIRTKAYSLFCWYGFSAQSIVG